MNCFCFSKKLDYDNKNIPQFSLATKKEKVKVISVYDGDTVTLVFPFEGNLYKKNCRLHGIDCSEIKSKNLEEKKDAQKAKEYLSSLILNKIIYAEFLKEDKYGRPLVILKEKKDSNISYNDVMIDSGYAQRYLGGTKAKFSKK